MIGSGVGRVAVFNWPKYVLASALLGGAAVLSTGVTGATGLVRPLAALSTVGLLYGVAGSLAATWWVYDHRASDLYQRVASKHVPSDPWIMVHAGLDESRCRLEELIGPAQQHFDVGPTANISRSLKRAHRWVGRCGDPWRGALDATSNSIGLAVVLFGIHELSAPASAKLLSELRRVVRSGGEIVIVEHLRDLPNAMAFGPGMLHFGSRRRWRSAISAQDSQPHARTVLPVS